MTVRPLWFFWGQETMTFLRWVTVLSARQMHGDVRMVLRKDPIKSEVRWGFEKQDFQYENPGYIDRAGYLQKFEEKGIRVSWLNELCPEIERMGMPDVQTSDLIAWWLLANEGGTVADMDIVFLKPLPRVDAPVKVVRFAGYPRVGYVPVTFMQGTPCKTWSEIYDRAVIACCPKRYESAGSGNVPIDLPGVLSDYVVFPWARLASSGMWRRWLFGSKEWPAIPDDCVGIHWYAGGNQQWNQSITGPETLPLGAMGWAVKGVLDREGERS